MSSPRSQPIADRASTLRIVITLADDGVVEVYSNGADAQVLLIDQTAAPTVEEYRRLRTGDGAGGVNVLAGAFCWREIAIDPPFVTRAMQLAGPDPYLMDQAARRARAVVAPRTRRSRRR